ncbi:MAG: hypothetical protein AAF663_02300 [Planctomycetota bacterium]
MGRLARGLAQLLILAFDEDIEHRSWTVAGDKRGGAGTRPLVTNVHCSRKRAAAFGRIIVVVEVTFGTVSVSVFHEAMSRTGANAGEHPSFALEQQVRRDS